MALVTCADCGAQISSEAPACIKCGRPKDAGKQAMGLDKVRFGLVRALWWVQKRLDKRRKPTNEQGAALADYYTRAMNIFRTLGIDLNSKPADVQRLYSMTLLFLDDEHVICPAEARTASLIGFLDSLNSGWALPPTSTPVSKEFAAEVDGYMAVEILRNHLGLQNIRDELVDAINTRSAQLKGAS